METSTEQTPVRPVPDDSQLQPKQQQDYWGFYQTERFVFPDGVTYLEIKAMNEGDKQKFQKTTQRDMVLEKGSGNARFKIDAGIERRELLRASVTDWNFIRGEQAIPFSERIFLQWLDVADPTLVEKIEVFIRKLNPWMLADLSVEEIDRQIEELNELRAVAEERERGEESSSSK